MSEKTEVQTIIETDKQDSEKKINKLFKTKDNISTSYKEEILKYKWPIIMITIIVIIIIILIIKPSSTGKNVEKTKKNKKTKETTDDDIDTESSEGYKPDRVRDDPYDEYDLESEIKKLLRKQEKYLEKINRYS